MAFGDLFRFNDVFESEKDSINKRRKRLRDEGVNRPDIDLEPEAFDETKLTASDGTTPLRPTEKSEVVGLSLSGGGGVRSAAFCLGALQALHGAGILKKVDYLSTVSGGGYTGASVSAGMTADGGHFPFESYLSEDETPSLQHVRDYSNYLFPNGLSDILYNVSIYLRGLVANAVLVLPFLLVFAAFTIISKPVVGQSSEPNLLGYPIPNVFSFNHFVVTSYLGIALLAFVIVWGIQRSFVAGRAATDFPSAWTTFGGRFLLVVLLSAFCELQPFILDAMFDEQAHGFFPSLVATIRHAALYLAPLAAAIAFAAHKFGEVVKSALESEKIRKQIFGYAAKLVIYVAGVIVPLLLWILYLQFAFWGLRSGARNGYYAPGWIADLAGLLPDLTTPIWGGAKLAIAELYVVVSVVCVIIALFLRPNANSLHALYRDRLSKAFIFRPRKTVPRDSATGAQPPLDPQPMKLTELSEQFAPYHLVNTALNVEGSKEVNRRNRNADFFLLSRNFVGSRTTDYVATADMEQVMPGLDVGTAVAISGAAVSSDMGAATIKPLVPTLALLNIRLAYWMRNPKWVFRRGRWNRCANYYFLREAFGGLTEKLKSVYLSDGGHIENLGMYELLRRRCKVIIAVDSEADPQMAFGAFNVLERYARIDLGVRIDLPWQQITSMTRATGEAIDSTGDCVKNFGPHVAVGEISYPGGRKGVLVYIKSSLTGDENDYVFHYKKRYSAFPHETTLDQLFSEEQFEAYRALGFHAANRFFDRRDDFAHLDSAQYPCARDHLEFLDQMFPVTAAPDPCWPRQHATFVDWLSADAANAVTQAARAQANAASPGVIAQAASKIADAVAANVPQPTSRRKKKR